MDLTFDYKETQFTNIESKHLSLLIMMKSAQTLFNRMGDFGNTDGYKEFEKFYYSLPTELLSSLGYSKNRKSFERMNTILSSFLSKKNIYELAIETEEMYLPMLDELSFLRVQDTKDLIKEGVEIQPDNFDINETYSDEYTVYADLSGICSTVNVGIGEKDEKYFISLIVLKPVLLEDDSEEDDLAFDYTFPVPDGMVPSLSYTTKGEYLYVNLYKGSDSHFQLKHQFGEGLVMDLVEDGEITQSLGYLTYDDMNRIEPSSGAIIEEDEDVVKKAKDRNAEKREDNKESNKNKEERKL